MKEEEQEEVQLRLTDSEVYEYPRRKDSAPPPMPPSNSYETHQPSVPMKDTSRFGGHPQAIQMRGATYQMVEFD